MLHDLRYKTRRVSSDREALAVLADDMIFDLVFSDLIMPGVNGFELAMAIRENYPGLPVVLTSGYSHVLAENAHHGFELVRKPYSVESLRVLRKAIAQRTGSIVPSPAR
jgi:CheY-like chemotaxis protein